MIMELSWFLLGLLALMLLACSWWDLKTRTIPNWLNLAIALLAIAFWYSVQLPLWPEVALRVGVAFIAFWVFAAAFAMGAMGGGFAGLRRRAFGGGPCRAGYVAWNAARAGWRLFVGVWRDPDASVEGDSRRQRLCLGRSGRRCADHRPHRRPL